MASDELRQFVVGPIQTNCYAYSSGDECMVVDPGYAGDQIADALEQDGLTVTCIVCTHGHSDHVGGVAALVSRTGAPFMLSAADVDVARELQDAAHFPGEEQAPMPDRTLAEGDVVTVGTARFRVMETPGHTPGGIVLVGEGSAEGVAFVGDTLFPSSHGRTDLPGGSESQILKSLSRMASEINPSVSLFTGHGPSTTMERELRQNPFLS